MVPSIAEVRDLERKTLQAISTIGAFAKLSELRDQAKAQVNKISVAGGHIDVHLGFNLEIRFRSDPTGLPKKRRIEIGAWVGQAQDKKTVKNASYGVMIADSDDPRSAKVLRKFHFDYEPRSFRMEDPKPSVHLQICGKLSSHHTDAGYPAKCIVDWRPDLDKPRIPSLPVSLALVLDWLFLEFQSSQATLAILREPGWRALVGLAERTVLVRYFKDGATFLEKAGNERKGFCQNHLYEAGA